MKQRDWDNNSAKRKNINKQIEKKRNKQRDRDQKESK